MRRSSLVHSSFNEAAVRRRRRGPPARLEVVHFALRLQRSRRPKTAESWPRTARLIPAPSSFNEAAVRRRRRARRERDDCACHVQASTKPPSEDGGEAPRLVPVHVILVVGFNEAAVRRRRRGDIGAEGRAGECTLLQRSRRPKTAESFPALSRKAMRLRLLQRSRRPKTAERARSM